MTYYFLLALVLFFYMNCWFVVSLITKRNDVADIAWGLGFVLLAWVSLIIGNQLTLSGIIAALLVTIWGIRLASHIVRRVRNKPEDARYAKWRQDWGNTVVLRSYFQIYILQGIFLYCIVSPVLLINQTASEFSVWNSIGIAVWVIGFYFESVGDAQLSRFVKNPENKGKIMQEGLWRYSRHPNYFGEVTQWWGIFFMALSSPNGWVTIVGPLTITILILFVSGIPLLEKKYAGRTDFEDYKRRTSVFFPRI